MSGNFCTINVISINLDLILSKKDDEENKGTDRNTSLNNIGKRVEETDIIYRISHASVMWQ